MKKTTLSIIFTVSVFLLVAAPAKVSKYITVDQFGYIPQAQKIAVIRDPQTGFDAQESFTPGEIYQLRKWDTDEIVYSASISVWNQGLEDPSSGDKAWWFDFSSVTASGTYYVYDRDKEVGSYPFQIDADVYREVLKHAVRTFYYQRSGTAKLAVHAGQGWADEACFIGPLQDKNCRLYSDPNNPATERDLSGGWFDAGDYNKYTSFVWNVLPEMLSAYEENPKVWADDYNLPESGNGIPDLLDEIKWELDWLLKMQQQDGSVLSIVGVGITEPTNEGYKNATTSPPSATKGQSLYGPATTDATYICAAIFAYAAKVYASLSQTEMLAYSQKLQQAALNAWTWADSHPNVAWRNNDAAYYSRGIGAGQSDKSKGVSTLRVAAACYLYALTGNNVYKSAFENAYEQVNMIQWRFAYKYESTTQDMMLYYTQLPNISPSVRDRILNAYSGSLFNSDDNLPSWLNNKDPYRGYSSDYVWGSNSFLCRQGAMYYNMKTYKLGGSNDSKFLDAAYGVINKMHGTNPLGLVYLSNMGKYGAENSCTQIWHSWFKDGSSKWDQSGVSQYGPPPGYVPGGPMSGYSKDACCATASCGSPQNNNACNSEPWLPIGQPKQKSYKDINTNWPLNTWTLSENAIYYQAAYVKLLSKFVSPINISTSAQNKTDILSQITVYPNPTTGRVSIDSPRKLFMSVMLINFQGQSLLQTQIEDGDNLDLSGYPKGMYVLKVSLGTQSIYKKICIE